MVFLHHLGSSKPWRGGSKVSRKNKFASSYKWRKIGRFFRPHLTNVTLRYPVYEWQRYEAQGCSISTGAPHRDSPILAIVPQQYEISGFGPDYDMAVSHICQVAFVSTETETSWWMIILNDKRLPISLSQSQTHGELYGACHFRI